MSSNDWWKQVSDLKNYGEPGISSGQSFIYKPSSPFNWCGTNQPQNNWNDDPSKFVNRYWGK